MMDFRHNQKPVPDLHGKIREVLISATDSDDPEELESTYGGLVDTLDGTVRFIILTQLVRNVDADVLMAAFGEDFGVTPPHERILILDPSYKEGKRDGPPSPWIQDPFTVLSGADGLPVFLEPYVFGRESRSQDRHIAEQVSVYTNYLMRSTKLLFEGGNLIANDGYLLIGKDTLYENLVHEYGKNPDFQPDSEQVKEITGKFKETFGAEHVVWVGLEKPNPLDWKGFPQGDYGFQPIFHLDMFVCPGGRTMDGSQLVLVAELDEVDIEQAPETNRDHWRSIQAILGQVRVNIERWHKSHPGPRFVVDTIPIGVRAINAWDSCLMSFNNCILEQYEGGVKIAYLPYYEATGRPQSEYLTELHKRVETKFSDHGFAVKFVKGRFFEMAPTYSSLHCLVKITRRGL